MERFWSPSQLEEVPLPYGAKTLATPAAGFVIAQVAARLQAALSAAGTALAGLAEP